MNEIEMIKAGLYGAGRYGPPPDLGFAFKVAFGLFVLAFAVWALGSLGQVVWNMIRRNR